MKSRINTISIPIQLIAKAQREKIVPELRMYIYMLINTSGTIKKNGSYYKILKRNYIKGVRTFDGDLSKLLKLNWIRFNPKSRVIHIVSMYRIIYPLNSYSTSRIRFKRIYFENFREFVFAAIVSERLHIISKGIKYGEKKGKYAELYKWSSIHHVTGFFPNYLGIPIHSIKGLTNLSTGRIVELKRRCRNLDFLKINNKYAYLKINPKDVPFFLTAFPSYNGRIKIKKGQVFLQLHDEISSSLIITSLSRKHAFQKIENQKRKKSELKLSKKLNLI